MSRRSCQDIHTKDLFRDFTPPTVVQRYSPERVRALSISTRIKQAVTAAIKDSQLGRDAICVLMSEALGETVTRAMLDQYTSPAGDKHIPTPRLIALFLATKDIRLVNALLADSGFIAVEARYEALIRREMAKEARDRLDREINAADAQWRAGK